MPTVGNSGVHANEATPEYVLFSEELYGSDGASLAEAVHEVWQDLEGIGPVRAYYVDVENLAGSTPPYPDPGAPREDLLRGRVRPAVHAGHAAAASYRLSSVIQSDQRRISTSNTHELTMPATPRSIRYGRLSRRRCRCRR
jgi:hypothetical protein